MELDQWPTLKTKTVTFAHSAPWFTPELHTLKKQMRQLERLHRKTGLTVHALAYKDHMHLYKSALNEACSVYYSGIIHSGSSNPCLPLPLPPPLTQNLHFLHPRPPAFHLLTHNHSRPLQNTPHH